MQTEIQSNYRFVSINSDDNFPINTGVAVSASVDAKELPMIAVGASAIATCLGMGELECNEVMVRYVDGNRGAFEEATIRRHDEVLAHLPKMAIEASSRGENSVTVDNRAYYRNFAYPQLNYPSPLEVLRVVEAIEALGFTAVLQPVNQGRRRGEEDSHSALYELKASLKASKLS